MQLTDEFSEKAHWFLRIGIASVFIYHGLNKFANLVPMAQMMKMPVFMFAMVASAETIGGALVLFGGFLKDWATRLGALLLGPVMLGAISMVHWGQWHFKATETHPMGGMQFQVTLLLVLLYLLFKGNFKTAKAVSVLQ